MNTGMNAAPAAGNAYPGNAYAGTPAPPPFTAVTPVAQPGTLVACSKCQKANVAGAKFCAGCGGAL
jgi:hypothetical protein